ncbi:MAG: ABC transporter substrate-binding protein [Trueperaceae bacterium]|nr:ABC transporter substrate-binding protein [Trueperaceae bacterium]
MIARRAMNAFRTVLFAASVTLISLSFAQSVPQGGTLTLAWAEPITVLDLAYGAGFVAYGGAHHLTDPLIRLSADGSPEPWLVREWEVSSDHMEYTLHLRDDVDFHDGEHFDAAALVANFGRTLDVPESMQYTLWNNTIESVEATGEYTVVIKLKVLDADFLYTTLAHWQIRPMSPADIPSRSPQTVTERYAGTGPFMFESFTPDSSLVLVRNENYWGGAPNIERLVFRFLPELSVHTVEMLARNVDVSLSIALDDQPLLARQGVEFVRVPWAVVNMLTMNVSKGHTAELAVRQAIIAAVDRVEIIETVLGGIPQLSRAGIPEGTVLYSDDVPANEFDPERARAILDEAGWLLGSDGVRYRDGQPLRLHFLNPTGGHARNAEIVQEQLRQVGIDTDMDISEGGTYGPRWREGDYELSMTAQGGSHWGAFLGGSVHPDDFWTVNQIRNSTDPELIAVADQLRTLTDGVRASVDLDERRELWTQAQRLFHEHALIYWLWHGPSTLAVQPWVKGYDFHSQTLFLHDAYIDR